MAEGDGLLVVRISYLASEPIIVSTNLSIDSTELTHILVSPLTLSASQCSSVFLIDLACGES